MIPAFAGVWKELMRWELWRFALWKEMSVVEKAPRSSWYRFYISLLSVYVHIYIYICKRNIYIYIYIYTHVQSSYY